MTILPKDEYNYKYVEFLLQNGADPNKQDKSGRTALLMVCYWNSPNLVELLLKYKANMDISIYQKVISFLKIEKIFFLRKKLPLK